MDGKKNIRIVFDDKHDWVIDLNDLEAVIKDGSIEIKIDTILENGTIQVKSPNYLLHRLDEKYFHSTLVRAECNGTVYYQPMGIEHGNEEKIGDIVLVFRKNPHSHRWMIQAEQEDVYITETKIEKTLRSIRSSLDNIIQAMKRRIVVPVGYINSNPRRIGGKPIKVHYVIAGWATQPEVTEQMLDIFVYVQSLDALGLSVLLKALTHMPNKTAKEIFGQIRKAPEDQE